ncbi:MAG: DUF1735 domain-containing protein [Ferruginibacter sp.]
MKKIIVSSLSVIALAILGTGCLKDKGFENQDYGTQVQDSRAVSFPQARSGPAITYGILSSLTPVDVSGPVIALEAPGAQSADTHVTLQINDALVTALPGVTILPASEYTIELSQVIVAGRTLDTVILNLPHSANLDPNLTYGIGLSITSADNSFTVASNMKDLVLKFGVKNKYDGVWTATPGAGSTNNGFVDHSNATFSSIGYLPYELRLVTAGPSTVWVTRLINGNWDPGYLFFTGTGGSYYGNFGLVVTFDATDHISDVHNYYGDPTNPPTGVGTPGGTGAPLYQSTQGPSIRRATIDPSGVNAYDESGAAPIIDIKYWMFQTTYMGDGSPRSEFDEHWERTGDRP